MAHVIQEQARKGRREAKAGRTVRTATLTYKVSFDGADAMPSEVLALDGVPHKGDSLDGDVKCKCRSVEAEQIAGGTNRSLWSVVAEFTTDKDAIGDDPRYPTKAAEYSYGFDVREEAIDRDRSDPQKPIVNTAFDPFDPPVTIEAPVPVLEINVNIAEEDFDENWIAQFFRATNSGTFRGQSEGKWLCQDVRATQQEWTDDDDEDHTYFACSFKLAFNKDGWKLKKLSQGFRELVDGEDGQEKRPIAYGGRDVSSPVMLSSAGQAILGDDPEDAYYCEFTVYDSVSFSDLEF